MLASILAETARRQLVQCTTASCVLVLMFLHTSCRKCKHAVTELAEHLVIQLARSDVIHLGLIRISNKLNCYII